MHRALLAVLLTAACTPLTPPPSPDPEEPPSPGPEPVLFGFMDPGEPATPKNDRWIATLGGTDIDRIADAALCPDGALALVGEFHTRLDIDDTQDRDEPLTTREDIEGLIGGTYLVVLEPTGRTRFARTIHEEGTLVARSVVCGSEGDLSVAGWFDGQVTIGGHRHVARAEKQELYSRGDEDGFIAHYTAQGNLKRVDVLGGPDLDISDLARAPNGDLVVAGRHGGPLEVGGQTLPATKGRALDNGFVARLDPEGRARWVREFSGPGQDFANAIAVTHQGHVLVAGDCRTNRFRAGEHRLDCGVDTSGFAARLSANGDVEWLRALRYHRPEGSTAVFTASGNGVAALPDGSALITGMFVENLEVSPGHRFQSHGHTDAVVVRYDTEGTVQWARQVGGAGQDRIAGPISDGRGGAWVAGTIAGVPRAALGAVLQGEGMEADDPPVEAEPLRWPDSGIFLHVDTAGSWGHAFRLGGGPGAGRDDLFEGLHVMLDRNERLRLVGMYTGTLWLPSAPEPLVSRSEGGVANMDDTLVMAVDVPRAAR